MTEQMGMHEYLARVEGREIPERMSPREQEKQNEIRGMHDNKVTIKGIAITIWGLFCFSLFLAQPSWASAGAATGLFWVVAFAQYRRSRTAVHWYTLDEIERQARKR